MDKIRAAICVFEKFFGFARKDFKIFIVLIMIFIIIALSLFSYKMYEDRENERSKNDIGCEKRILKIEIFYTATNKILSIENDSLKKTIISQQNFFSKEAERMKNEQIAILKSLVSMRKK